MGSGKLIKLAIKKYGIGNFKKIILLKDIFIEEIIFECEKNFISIYRSLGKAEYNISKGGKGGYLLEYANEKKKKEHNRKISETMKGKISNAFGKFHSKETRKKMSEAKIGKPHSEETKQKISEKNKGHDVSTETREKISKANKGQSRSKETRKKMSEAKIGKPHSEETKQKISKAMKLINRIEKNICIR